jgi:hypothetical protein
VTIQLYRYLPGHRRAEESEDEVKNHGSDKRPESTPDP